MILAESEYVTVDGGYYGHYGFVLLVRDDFDRSDSIAVALTDEMVDDLITGLTKMRDERRAEG